MIPLLFLLLACRSDVDPLEDDELVDDDFVELVFDEDDDLLAPDGGRHDLALEVLGLDAWERATAQVVVTVPGGFEEEAAQVLQGRIAVFFAAVLEPGATHVVRWWVDLDEDGACDPDEPADDERLVDVTGDVVLLRTLPVDATGEVGTCRDTTWDLLHSP